MNKRTSRLKKGGAVVVLSVGLVGSAEGLRQTAYPDPATQGKPWTVCYGATTIDGRSVRPGERFSLDECKALLLHDLERFATGIEKCVTAPLPDHRYVALVSFAFNVGTGTACKSSVVRKINAGDVRGGCDALLLYNRAAGIVFPGLTKRRERERAYCLRDD